MAEKACFMELLSVSHLRKRFDEILAVDDVSFTVNEGEIFGLLGPNGAGKSTTMMMIAGLLTSDEGEVRLGGQQLTPQNREMRTQLGVVPQDLAIYPELTAWENLSFFGKLYGLRGAALKERIEESLSRTGLTDRARSKSGVYSGGMKRRLNFGIALLHQPKLLILDEPTVGVDPQSRAHLLDCIRQLRSEGVGVIYASHYMEEVEDICDRVAIVDHGKVLACDTIKQLLSELKTDLSLRIDEPPPEVRAQLIAFNEVMHAATVDGELQLSLRHDKHDSPTLLNETLFKITQFLRDNHVRLRSIETREPDLEHLFLDLTGRRLRD